MERAGLTIPLIVNNTGQALQNGALQTRAFTSGIWFF
jgi:hypothetical protein